MSAELDDLLVIMVRLRDPERGCEWDAGQTFATIAPYTIEEAYEVADAIERGAMEELRDELGDLLLQVVFHARMAEEAGHFAFEDVARAIGDKMKARHPQIFGSNASTDDASRWEDIKATERERRGATSAMDGVARALPALLRAEKLQQRAARDGFDWPDAAGPAAKLVEEALELGSARTGAETLEEAGDLLFAAVNLVRAYGVAPEAALREANGKFERRYRAMEALAATSSTAASSGSFARGFSALNLAQQEALWQQVKTAEKTASD